jgi:hypothetical protein
MLAMQEYGHRNGDDAGINRTRLKLSHLLNKYSQDLTRQNDLVSWAMEDFNLAMKPPFNMPYEYALKRARTNATLFLRPTDDATFVNELRNTLCETLDTN